MNARGARALDAREHALLAAEAASDKKAVDLIAMNVADQLVVTDYFVIATGTSDRHVATIAEAVERRMRDAGVHCIGREGEREARWILLDFGDVVMHVFQPAEREFYRLDKLWNDAERLALPEEIASPETAGAGAGAPDGE
ncbi:MAG: ribosome silencing factor [Actinobacteria bacterium]|nr:MAG: ribosome silencing factor [Actinomycetota bacterium]